MANGGKRPGAGRKKGGKASHTLKAEQDRKYLIEQVIKEIEPLVSALIKQGKAGNITALKEIFDRVLGKVTDDIRIGMANSFKDFLLEIQNRKQPVVNDRERIEGQLKG
jgi:hypothetical protein